MLTRLLYAAGIIFAVLTLLAFLAVIAYSWVTFLIISVVCLVLAYVLSSRGTREPL